MRAVHPRSTVRNPFFWTDEMYNPTLLSSAPSFLDGASLHL